MQKKTLITKVPIDATFMSEAQIAACRSYMKKAFEHDGITVEFEVVAEEITMENFLKNIEKQMGAQIDKVLSATSVDEGPMEVMALDEGQSNVLHGFFGRIPGESEQAPDLHLGKD